MARRGRSGRLARNKAEDRMTRVLDNLAEYEEHRELLIQLKRAMEKGAGSEEILQLAQSAAAIRLALIATTEKDTSKALQAVRDLLDRTQGKPTEKKEISHKFDNLPEEQLDALIQSDLDELNEEKPKH